MSLLGYCRVSREEQNLFRQIDELEAAGCDIIYQEKQSGNNKKIRPEFERLISEAQKGDTIVCCKIDRFGRSLIHILSTLEQLNKRGIEFKSLGDNFDTKTASGRLTLHMLLVFSQFEREIIADRTKDALKSAKRRGIQLGRRKDPVKEQEAKRLMGEGKGQDEIMAILGVKKSRYYELIAK